MGGFLIYSLVGVLGIGPSLPAPKAGVLPVYDTPSSHLADTSQIAPLRNIYGDCATVGGCSSQFQMLLGILIWHLKL